jgi:hypothetical protein
MPAAVAGLSAGHRMSAELLPWSCCLTCRDNLGAAVPAATAAADPGSSPTAAQACDAAAPSARCRKLAAASAPAPHLAVHRRSFAAKLLPWSQRRLQRSAPAKHQARHRRQRHQRNCIRAHAAGLGLREVQPVALWSRKPPRRHRARDRLRLLQQPREQPLEQRQQHLQRECNSL